MTDMGGQEFSYVPKIMNGGLAGIVGVTCVFPIDLVKTRLQNQPILPDGKVQYRGIFDCAKQTWRSGGVSIFSKVRALYSGSAVNIVLITPEKAIKLVANDFFRYHLAVPGEKTLSAWRGMAAGGLAGMFQIIVTTPMELLKIQMQDQGRTALPGQKKMTALQLTARLLKEHGIAGLYKGLGSTFARDVTFSVIYFPLFAYLDSLGPRKSDGSGDAVFWTSFVAGLTSGASASFAVTPLDVIKTRMQTINKGANEVRYKNIADAFVRILQMEGPRALFKGAACRMMVMAPLFGIAQTVYYIGVAEKILGVQKATHI
ncbi:putative glutamate carrier 1 [Oesophagostomum dentatum]|uniref:Putative glutamate carrier 1 n=1 Tax=Oesophagostomum dentatum TaxID=61180 RepID=A0A0B1TDV6_OESDE|nr:putative glutamate carrier 1 [Oesophagostomum dentatum]